MCVAAQHVDLRILSVPNATAMWPRAHPPHRFFRDPQPNDLLQRWPVSKRVNSSKADADDATLIEKIALQVA